MLIFIFLWLAPLTYSQEKPATSEKKDGKEPTGILTNFWNGQKEKYQKEIQEKIKLNIDYLDNKINDLKSLTASGGIKSNVQGNASTKDGEPQKEAVNKKPQSAEEKAKPTQPTLWDKLVSFSEAYVGYVKKAYGYLANFFNSR